MKVTSDWLGTNKVYYNTRTKAISENINHVIDFDTFEWHPEGLKNYLDFGYSVFEQTPVKDVKFLHHDATLEKLEGELKVTYQEDSSLDFFGKITKEEDVIALLRDKIQTWEKETKGEIIVPTSGGYDSRLLNLLIEDKSRIRAFTYGISTNQAKSYEVVYAKKLCELLNIKWNHIPLTKIHNYIDKWDSIYGVSTHAHGMYHMEFYDKMNKQVEGGNPFLSGIIGDAWAGSVVISSIKNSNELQRLGYSHGLKADSQQLVKQTSSNDLSQAYFENKKELLSTSEGRVIESMRKKIILLNYLLKIPKHYGFQPYSPFVEKEVALAMLMLPEERKKDRLWQQELFKKSGLNFEDMNLSCSKQNDLAYQNALNVSLSPLNSDELREIINANYIDWINKKTLQRTKSRYKEKTFVLKLKNAILPWSKQSTFDVKAYTAYLTLFPLAQLIKRRNAYLSR